MAASTKIREKDKPVIQDAYTLTSGSKKRVAKLLCKSCNEVFPIKSNKGIIEEVNRVRDYMVEPPEVSCPDVQCSNHIVGITAGKKAYQSFGKTKSGSKRFKCKACSKTFSVKKATTGQKLPHKNKLIFKLLMNKSPFRRICEIAEISHGSLYPKINFLHRQSLAFIADRERKLLQGKNIRRLYISSDRQEYVVNWTQRKDKRNIKLSAIGSADNVTGYVFAMNLNYDPAMIQDKVETESLVDQGCKHAFRQHARLWLVSDYDESLLRSKARINDLVGLKGNIQQGYDDSLQREDIEDHETLNSYQQLPSKGMQVHADYTLYGHFIHLHRLFGGVEKVRFFIDQDSGMRAACLTAFQKEIQNRSCDAYYVRLDKSLTVDEKRQVLANSRKIFKQEQKKHPDLSKNELKLKMIKQRMKKRVKIGSWKDEWLLHPFPNMSEPEKAICYLTDYGDYDEDHQAWLYNMASMHSIDCFFMQVRRRLSLLERPISSVSDAGRRWLGYSAYNPNSIIKVLDIFRVYYNYCLKGQDG